MLIPWRRQNKMGPLEVWLLASAANGGWSFGFLKPPRLSVSRPSVPRRLLAHPIQNLPHIRRPRRGRPLRQRGGDGAHNVVAFEPDQKPRLVRTGKPGLVDPCVVRSHVPIGQGAFRVFWLLQGITCQQLLHRSTPLAGRESREQSKRLRTMQTLTRCPLHERCAIDLASRSLS